MKTIALFFPSFRGGGAERVMITIARELISRGYSVDIVVANASGPYIKEVPEAANIIDLKAKKVLFSLFGLVGYLRRTRPSALLSTMNNANIVAAVAKKLSLVRCCLVLREANTISYAAQSSGNIVEKILPRLMRWVYPIADHVIAVSGDVRRDLIDDVKLKEALVSVIFNPVYDDVLIARSEGQLPEDFPITQGDRFIVGMGRLSRQKDFATLIKAFALLMESCDARLIILGEGEDREGLEVLIDEQGVSDFVHLYGFCENPFPILRSADLFVLSSLWEGMPNALIQALCLGAKVVSTDCPGGSREVLDSGRWGGLVPVSSPEHLARAMKKSLDGGRLFGESERIDYCTEHFGVRQVVDKYIKLLS